MAVLDQTVLALQPFEQWGGRRGLQKAGHRPSDGSAVDELPLPLENGLVVRIEADNEAPQYPEPALLDPLNLAEAVAAQVLILSTFLQPFRGGRLDSDEDIKEIRLYHGRKQFGSVRQVDRDLGVEREGNSVAFLP